ncbi:MAG TPA: STAS domain-containing protein [Tepidisphaeraceae bacterium]|jgi:anti-sigma B factor antagonist
MNPPTPVEMPFLLSNIEGWTVVEFRTASLMDPVQLERVGEALYRLVDAEDRRLVIMDFANVQYISSQAIGIVLTMNKKLSSLKRSKLVLCGVGAKLMELIKITRLDRILTIKPTQREAVKVQNAL